MSLDFESLLHARELEKRDSTVISSAGKNEDEKEVKRVKADTSASLYKCMGMIAKLVELTMPNVKFIPDEGKLISLDAMKTFDHPVITYTVISRVPEKEIKPRYRESIEETDVTDDTERVGEVWGQRFKCLVQFNIYASVYKEAEQVMEMFEETIFKYTGFLKKNGVAEIIFSEHLTDTHFDTMRETLSIRNLRYYVEIEKLTVIFKEKIQEIESQIQDLSL